MTNNNFMEYAKRLVADYTNQHMGKTNMQEIKPEDVYIVWMCKTLQNCKALLSTPLPNGMYYEATYNGNKQELYLDAYKKFENRCYTGVV